MKAVRSWKSLLSMLVTGSAVIVLGTPAAQAQIVCIEPDDVAEEALEFYLEWQDRDFGVDLGDEELCGSLTENFVKACTTAVKDQVKCFQNLWSLTARQDQISCKGTLTGDAVKQCTAGVKQAAKSEAEDVKAFGEFVIAVGCEQDLAEDYFEVCMVGF